MTEPDDTEPDMTVALDIIDLRFRALEIASHEDLAPEGVVALANYYFNFGLTGVIVPYPKPPDNGAKPKKLKVVT